MTKFSQKQDNRENQSLNNYLLDIGKVPLLTPQEEIHLSHCIKKNDQEALEKLTKANLRFVVSVAKQGNYILVSPNFSKNA